MTCFAIVKFLCFTENAFIMFRKCLYASAEIDPKLEHRKQDGYMYHKNHCRLPDRGFLSFFPNENTLYQPVGSV